MSASARAVRAEIARYIVGGNGPVGKPTVVDDITEQLAYRIAAGRYRPGELLPSVRQVAAEFGASTPTANSALGRLAALGFAEPRRGLGYIARDIRLYGGVDTWRFLFRFAKQIPEQAIRLFADVIDIDHMLCMQAIRAFAADPRRYDMTRVGHALDQFELLINDGRSTQPELLSAELHLLRCTFAAVGNPGYLSLFNTMGEVLVTIPEAAAAFYGPLEPAGHLFFGRQIQRLRELESNAELPDVELIDTLMRTYHDQVVETFRELITKGESEAAAG